MVLAREIPVIVVAMEAEWVVKEGESTWISCFGRI